MVWKARAAGMTGRTPIFTKWPNPARVWFEDNFKEDIAEK
jgi:hypothetical protein